MYLVSDATSTPRPFPMQQHRPPSSPISHLTSSAAYQPKRLHAHLALLSSPAASCAPSPARTRHTRPLIYCFAPQHCPPPRGGAPARRAPRRPFLLAGQRPGARRCGARPLTPARGMTPRRRARTPAHRAVRRSEHVRCGCAAPPLATGVTIATASGSPESLRGNRKSAEGAHLAAERLRARRSPQRRARGRSTGAHAEP